MHKLLSLTAISLTLLAPTAQAYERNTLVLGLGSNNVFKKADDEVGFEAEIRFAKFSPSTVWGIDGLSPYVSTNVAADGSFDVSAGGLYDWEFSNQWHLVPQFGVALYHAGSSGRDIGGAFNFRSSIGLDYEIDQTSRVGVQLMHLSHTSLLYDKNPGTEHLILNYQYGM